MRNTVFRDMSCVSYNFVCKQSHACCLLNAGLLPGLHTVSQNHIVKATKLDHFPCHRAFLLSCLTTLSILRLYSIDEKMINECEAVG